MLELEFFSDIHIYYTELPHVFRELVQFEIGHSYKKLWPSEDMSFSRFLSAHYLGGAFSHYHPKTWIG